MPDKPELAGRTGPGGGRRSAISRRMSRRGRDFRDLERDTAAVAESGFPKALTGVSMPMGF